MRALAGVFAAGLLAGCQFDGRIPEGVVVRCEADLHCPSGQKCVDGTCAVPVAPDLTPLELTAGSVATRLLPRFGNPLAEPTALGPLVDLDVTFALTGQPRRPLGVRATDALGCDFAAPTRLRCGLGVGSVDGQASVTLILPQPDGGAVDVLLGDAVPVQVTAPALQLTGGNGPRQRRMAFGPDKGTTLTSGPGLAPPRTWFSIREGDAELLRVLPTEDGALDAGLPGRTSVAAQLSVIDVAGNRSAWLPVDAITWVGSLHETARDSDYPNPLALRLYPVAPEGLEAQTGPGQLVVEEDGVGTADGRGPTIAGQPVLRWLSYPSGSGFSIATPALAWDEYLNVFRSLDQRFDGRAWTDEVLRDAEGDGNPTGLDFAWFDLAHRRVLGTASGALWARQQDSWVRLDAGATLWPVHFFDARRRIAWHCSAHLDDGGAECVSLDEDLAPRTLRPSFAGLVESFSTVAAYDEARELAYFFGGELSDGGVGRGGVLSTVDGGVAPWVAAARSAAWAQVDPHTGDVLLGNVLLVDGGQWSVLRVRRDGGVQGYATEHDVSGNVALWPGHDALIGSSNVQTAALDLSTLQTRLLRTPPRQGFWGAACSDARCVAAGTIGDVEWRGDEVLPLATNLGTTGAQLAWHPGLQRFTAYEPGDAGVIFVLEDGGWVPRSFGATDGKVTRFAPFEDGVVFGGLRGLSVRRPGRPSVDMPVLDAFGNSANVRQWSVAPTLDGGSVWLATFPSFCSDCPFVNTSLVAAFGAPPWTSEPGGGSAKGTLAHDDALDRTRWIAVEPLGLSVRGPAGWSREPFVTLGGGPSFTLPTGELWARYEPAAARTHVFAGSTRVLELDGAQRPAAVLTVPVAVLQRRPGERLTVVRLLVVGGAQSGGASEVPLAQLFVGGRWASLPLASALGTTPLRYEASGSAELEVQLERTRSVAFRLTPRGTNGRTPAALSLDDVRVELEWRSQGGP